MLVTGISAASFSPPDLSDQALLESGLDRSVIVAELFRRHRTYCTKVASGFLGNPNDAEDVVQEAFLRVCLRLNTFCYRSSFRSWLTRILINECLTVKRRQPRLPVLSLNGAREAGMLHHVRCDSSTPEEMHYEQELRVTLSMQFLGLPPHHRIPLMLQTVDGLGVNAIAHRLGITPQATRSRLHRARLTLRCALLPWLSGVESGDTAVRKHHGHADAARANYQAKERKQRG